MFSKLTGEEIDNVSFDFTSSTSKNISSLNHSKDVVVFQLIPSYCKVSLAQSLITKNHVLTTVSVQSTPFHS